MFDHDTDPCPPEDTRPSNEPPVPTPAQLLERIEDLARVSAQILGVVVRLEAVQATMSGNVDLLMTAERRHGTRIAAVQEEVDGLPCKTCPLAAE